MFLHQDMQVYNYDPSSYILPREIFSCRRLHVACKQLRFSIPYCPQKRKHPPPHSLKSTRNPSHFSWEKFPNPFLDQTLTSIHHHASMTIRKKERKENTAPTPTTKGWKILSPTTTGTTWESMGALPKQRLTLHIATHTLDLNCTMGPARS